MRYRKNKKRIDPRYFLEETVTRGEEIEEFQIREGGYAGHYQRSESEPRKALLQAIAVATSHGDLKTAYELLASVSTEEALAIIAQGIEDVLGIAIEIEDDEDTDEMERVDEGAREDVDQFADVVDIIQGAGEPFIDVGRQPTRAFETPPLKMDPVGVRTARKYKAETPGEKVDRVLKHKISQAISPQSRSRRRRVRRAAHNLGKLGTAGAVADLALAATDSDATGAQRGARGSGAAGELAYLKSLTPKGQQAVRIAAGRPVAGALSKAAPGAFAAQAGYELGKQASPLVADWVEGDEDYGQGSAGEILFAPGAAEHAGKGITDIDWRPPELMKTLKYMYQPPGQQREGLNLQLSTQSLKEIIQEEIEVVLREALKASKSVGDPPYRERGSTESQAQQMAAGAALSARRGKTPVSKLKGASLDLYNGKITTKELRNLAKLGQKVKGHKTKEPKHRKSLPGHATPAKD